MLSSALIFTLLSTSLALPSNHQLNSPPVILADRDIHLDARTAPSLESTAFPLNISITNLTSSTPPTTNLTFPGLRCFSPAQLAPTFYHPTELDCLRAISYILLEHRLFDFKHWSATGALIVARWVSGTCKISIVGKRPSSEDTFPEAYAASAAALVMRTCVTGAHRFGGEMDVGPHNTFVVMLTGLAPRPAPVVADATVTA